MLLRSHNNKNVREKLEEFLKERMVWQNGCHTIIGYLYFYTDTGTKQIFKSIRTFEVLWIQLSDCVNNVFQFELGVRDAFFITNVKKYNKGRLVYSKRIRAFQTYYIDFLEGAGVHRVFEDKYVVTKSGSLYLNTPHIKRQIW